MHLKQFMPRSDYYRIRVIPNQSKTEVREIMTDGTIKIAIKAAPEKGKANKALIEFIAKELGLDKSSVTITQGLTSREKVIYVDYGLSTSGK